MLTDRAGAARRTGQGNLIPGGLECVPGFSQLGKPYASRSATELGGGGHDEEHFFGRRRHLLFIFSGNLLTGGVVWNTIRISYPLSALMTVITVS